MAASFPGIRPGERTAEYIDFVLTRITVIGAMYLVFRLSLTRISNRADRRSVLSGWNIASDRRQVTLDTVAQVQGHLIAQQYEGLIKKSKLRGGKRGR
jgi:preprotein translocase subunit SecY